MANKVEVIAMGEVVMDAVEGQGAVVAGAPLNFLRMLDYLKHIKDTRVELEGVLGLISAVGNDEDGNSVLSKLDELGIDKEGVQRNDAETGRVPIKFVDESPIYDIKEGAWDDVEKEKALQYLQNLQGEIRGGVENILVHGTLIARSPQSKEALDALRERSGAVFYDMNLREAGGTNFTKHEVVVSCLEGATVVKGGKSEIKKVYHDLFGKNFDDTSDVTIKTGLQRVLDKHSNIQCIVVTDEGRGSFALSREGAFARVEGVSVDIEEGDSVGAGDAFFAGYIYAHLQGASLHGCLEAGNKTGSHMATLKGGLMGADDEPDEDWHRNFLNGLRLV